MANNHNPKKEWPTPTPRKKDTKKTGMLGWVLGLVGSGGLVGCFGRVLCWVIGLGVGFAPPLLLLSLGWWLPSSTSSSFSGGSPPPSLFGGGLPSLPLGGSSHSTPLRLEVRPFLSFGRGFASLPNRESTLLSPLMVVRLSSFPAVAPPRRVLGVGGVGEC